MLINESVVDFVNNTASKEPVPGGGGVSALVGGLGIGLGEMALNLTRGKKGFLEIDNELLDIRKRLNSLKDEMLSLVEKDAEGFLPLLSAYSLPKNTPSEIKLRKEAIEKGYISAIKAPIKIVKLAFKTANILEELLPKTSKLLVSDIGVASQMVRSAINGGYVNAIVNLKYIEDREFKEKTEKEINHFLIKGIEICDRVYKDSIDKITQG